MADSVVVDPEREFLKALSKAQGTIKAAVFDSVNPHFKSKYASLGSVMDCCKLALAENGFCISHELDRTEFGWVLLATLAHEAGYRQRTVVPLMLASNATMQNLGASISYARRYAINCMLNLVSEEDTDGNNTGKPPGKPKDEQERGANQSKPSGPSKPKPVGSKPAGRPPTKLLEEDPPGPMLEDPFPDMPPFDAEMDSDLDRALDRDDDRDQQIAAKKAQSGTESPFRTDDTGKMLETITKEQAENLKAIADRCGFTVERMNLLIQKFCPKTDGRWSRLTVPEMKFLIDYVKKPHPPEGQS